MNLKDDFVNIDKLRKQGKYQELTNLYNSFDLPKKVQCLDFMLDEGKHDTLIHLLDNLSTYTPLKEVGDNKTLCCGKKSTGGA